jgi:hypothetical protein
MTVFAVDAEINIADAPRGSFRERRGLIDVSKVSASELIDQLISNPAGARVLLPDGTVSEIKQDQIKRIVTQLEQLKDSNLTFIGKDSRDEFIKDAVLRATGIAISQGYNSAVCGVAVQTALLVREDPGRFLSMLTSLGDKGYCVDPVSGKKIEAKREFLKSDSSADASRVCLGRGIASRLWFLSLLEADNGTSFSVAIENGSEFSVGSDGSGLPEKFTGQPYNWVVNSARERFGKDFEAVYVEDNPKALQQLGNISGALAFIRTGSGNDPSSHVLIIDRVENGRIFFTDTRFDISSANKDLVQERLPAGAKIEGRNSWSMTIEEATKGPEPVLDMFLIERKGSKKMSIDQDRSISRYLAQVEAGQAQKITQFSLSPIDLIPPKSSVSESIANGKVGFSKYSKS